MNEKVNQGERAWNLERAVLDQVPATIFAVDKDLNLIFMNRAGRKWFGKEWKDLEGTGCHDLFKTNFCETEDCPMLKAFELEEVNYGQTEFKMGEEKVAIEFCASPLKDHQGNIMGGVEYVVDVTEKLAAEARARRLQEDLLELSTPVLSLWEDTLAIPLIGTLDSRRAQDAMEKALSFMADQKAKILIVDITGVPVMDTMVANHLIRLASAVHLMGGESILTGISPTTAKTIVHLGIDLSNLNTRSTLAQGLELAMEFVQKRRVRS